MVPWFHAYAVAVKEAQCKKLIQRTLPCIAILPFNLLNLGLDPPWSNELKAMDCIPEQDEFHGCQIVLPRPQYLYGILTPTGQPIFGKRGNERIEEPVPLCGIHIA